MAEFRAGSFCFSSEWLHKNSQSMNSLALISGASVSLPEISQVLAPSHCVQDPNPQSPALAQSSGLAPLQHGVEVDNLQDSQMAVLPGLAPDPGWQMEVWGRRVLYLPLVCCVIGAKPFTSLGSYSSTQEPFGDS